MNSNAKTWRTPTVVLIAGFLVSMIGFGARSGMGLYLDPMTVELGWGRVLVRTWSHDIDGLSKRDWDLIAKIERLV